MVNRCLIIFLPCGWWNMILSFCFACCWDVRTLVGGFHAWRRWSHWWRGERSLQIFAFLCNNKNFMSSFIRDIFILRQSFQSSGKHWCPFKYEFLRGFSTQKTLCHRQSPMGLKFMHRKGFLEIIDKHLWSINSVVYLNQLRSIEKVQQNLKDERRIIIVIATFGMIRRFGTQNLIMNLNIIYCSLQKRARDHSIYPVLFRYASIPLIFFVSMRGFFAKILRGGKKKKKTTHTTDEPPIATDPLSLQNRQYSNSLRKRCQAKMKEYAKCVENIAQSIGVYTSKSAGI